jgi:hypothetical protein
MREKVLDMPQKYVVSSNAIAGSKKRYRMDQTIIVALISAIVYGASLALAFLLAMDQSLEIAALALAHIGAAAAFLIYWRLGHWGAAKYACFGAVLLLIASIFRIQAAIDTVIYGMRIANLPTTVPLPEPLIWWYFKGELITNLGILLVVSTWRIVLGAQVEKHSFMQDKRDEPRSLLLLVYIAGIFVAVVGEIAPSAFGSLSQFASLTYSFAVASIFFLAAKRRGASGSAIVALVLAAPMVALALGTGMKEDLFLPLMPAALLFWFRSKSIARKTIAILVGISALAVAQLYIVYVRNSTWTISQNMPLVREQVPILETIFTFGKEFRQMSISKGFNQISERVNLTSSHAITVILADRYGYKPMEVFGLIPVSLIPRILWPNKPIIQPGAMQTERIRGTNNDLAYTSSATAAGFFTEMYLGAGFYGVIIGSVLYGTILAYAQRLTRKISPGFGYRAFSLILLYWTIRFDEKAVVYAYTSIVFSLIFVLLLTKGFAALGLRMKNSDHSLVGRPI